MNLQEIITGKFEEDFKNYYYDLVENHEAGDLIPELFSGFMVLPLSMSFGVIQDFLIDKAMVITITWDEDYAEYAWNFLYNNLTWGCDTFTIEEARFESIQKAVEIYNQEN